MTSDEKRPHQISRKSVVTCQLLTYVQAHMYYKEIWSGYGSDEHAQITVP